MYEQNKSVFCGEHDLLQQVCMRSAIGWLHEEVSVWWYHNVAGLDENTGAGVYGHITEYYWRVK